MLRNRGSSRLRLLDEHAGRSGTSLRAAAIRRQLVRRVADDHVELHIASKQLGDPSLDVVGVDERIGVGFEAFATVEESSGWHRSTCIARW